MTAWYEAISDGQDAHSLVQDRYGARSLVAESGSTRAASGPNRDAPSPGTWVTRRSSGPWRPRARPTSSCWPSAGPVCGSPGSAPRARPATPPTSPCRRPRSAWPRPSRRPGRRWSSCWSRAGRTPCPRSSRTRPRSSIAPYAGPFGNRSIADVLFGTVNPSGKLPYSVPRHSGQMPVYHHQKAGSGLPQPAVARRHAALPGHGGHPAVAVRSRAELQHLRAERPRLRAGHRHRRDRRGSARRSRTPAIATARWWSSSTCASTPRGSPGRPSSSAGSRGCSWRAGEQRRVTFAVDASQLAYTNLARADRGRAGARRCVRRIGLRRPVARGVVPRHWRSPVVPGAERSFLSTASIRVRAVGGLLDHRGLDVASMSSER